MLMTDGEIRQALETGKMVIGNYEESRLEPCSYDARLGREALVSRQYALLDLKRDNSLTLHAGDFALVMTHETFRLPLAMVAHIGMKSALARQGLVLLAGMQIDPGFDGHLRLGLYNASGRPVTIDYLDTICMIEFHALAVEAERGVHPFPELKEGRLPETDKAFLRELETTSLSDIQEELRILSQNVQRLTTITYKVFLPIFLAVFTAGVLAVIFK